MSGRYDERFSLLMITPATMRFRQKVKGRIQFILCEAEATFYLYIQFVSLPAKVSISGLNKNNESLSSTWFTLKDLILTHLIWEKSCLSHQVLEPHVHMTYPLSFICAPPPHSRNHSFHLRRHSNTMTQYYNLLKHDLNVVVKKEGMEMLPINK